MTIHYSKDEKKKRDNDEAELGFSVFKLHTTHETKNLKGTTFI